MRILLIVLSSAILMLQPAFAEGPGDGKGENFEKRKAMKLMHIEKRMAALTEHKTCVSNATKPADMKACHQAHKAKRESMRSEHRAMREDFKKNKKK